LLIIKASITLEHIIKMCARDLHKKNSPSVLLRATRPSSLNGCVGTLPKGYVHKNSPLPRVPKIQRAKSHQVNKIPDYYKAPYVVPTYETTGSLVESAAYAFLPAWHAIATNT
jgi:hypothetical protein